MLRCPLLTLTENFILTLNLVYKQAYDSAIITLTDIFIINGTFSLWLPAGMIIRYVSFLIQHNSFCREDVILESRESFE